MPFQAWSGVLASCIVFCITCCSIFDDLILRLFSFLIPTGAWYVYMFVEILMKMAFALEKYGFVILA